MKDEERRIITSALKETKWKVNGDNGAAKLLEMAEKDISLTKRLYGLGGSEWTGQYDELMKGFGDIQDANIPVSFFPVPQSPTSPAAFNQCKAVLRRVHKLQKSDGACFPFYFAD